jgi:hypothetical protein
VCAAILRATRIDPFEDALRRRLEVDAFILLTDHGADLSGYARYQRETGLRPKLVVMAAGRGEQLIDPADPTQVGISGYDPLVPGVLARFL